MSFKPSDANALLESVLDDLQKTLKKRNVKTPEVTIRLVQESLELAMLVLGKTVSGKRKKRSKTKGRKRAKLDDKVSASLHPSIDLLPSSEA